jgi:hypothetical protein
MRNSDLRTDKTGLQALTELEIELEARICDADDMDSGEIEECERWLSRVRQLRGKALAARRRRIVREATE